MTVNICVLSPTGQLVDKIPVTPGKRGDHTLGRDVCARGGSLRGGHWPGQRLSGGHRGRLLKIDVDSHVARDEDGNLYVADSARGVIYRVNPGRDSVRVE
jgi:energy-converting hydrogenase Eha subunit B